MAGTKLTKKEKRAGKRKLLIPSEQIQEIKRPISFEEFERAALRAVPPHKRAPPLGIWLSIRTRLLMDAEQLGAKHV
jgi:hypothetical protein